MGEKAIRTSVSPCPFSVEVVVSCMKDGIIKTSSFSPKRSCLADIDDIPAALVPVGSSSDSDDSDMEEERSSSALTLMAASKDVGSDTTRKSDEIGMVDCLSDQFSNMFCPADQGLLCMPKSENGSVASDTKNDTSVTAKCPNMSITEIFSPSDKEDVFLSLQYWLSPSKEEKALTSNAHTPQNRSTASLKRKSYIDGMWKTWHPDHSIPVARSKSMPGEPTPSVLDLEFHIHYDSDPEQAHHEKQERAKALKRPRSQSKYQQKRPLAIQTSFEEEDQNIRFHPPTPRFAHTDFPVSRFDFDQRRKTPRSRRNLHPYVDQAMNVQSEEFLKQYIQEVTNTRLELVWHRHEKQSSSQLHQPPVAVCGAFEVGAHLDTRVVQPKFTWSPAFEPKLGEHKISMHGTEPDAIELLSIIRVLIPPKLNRRRYPFARLDRTVCICTNDEKFPYLVFECSGKQERDWFVKALKIIVARLASIIIVRDETMLLEFFTPYWALLNLGVHHEHEHHGEDEESEEEDNDVPTLDPNGELHLVDYPPQCTTSPK